MYGNDLLYIQFQAANIIQNVLPHAHGGAGAGMEMVQHKPIRRKKYFLIWQINQQEPVIMLLAELPVESQRARAVAQNIAVLKPSERRPVSDSARAGQALWCADIGKSVRKTAY